MGHPAIRDWTSKSPDRVYQWAVEGHPECTAYLRIKAGKSRAGRGEYKRSKPFFCMKFDTAQHATGAALDILNFSFRFPVPAVLYRTYWP